MSKTSISGIFPCDFAAEEEEVLLLLGEAMKEHAWWITLHPCSSGLFTRTGTESGYKDAGESVGRAGENKMDRRKEVSESVDMSVLTERVRDRDVNIFLGGGSMSVLVELLLLLLGSLREGREHWARERSSSMVVPL